jgi:putative transposase
MRKPRQIQQNGTYHICARINRQEMIFSSQNHEHKKSDYIKELFMQVMKQAKTKYKFRCKSFCIMGNHVHLIIQTTDDESISCLMRWILSVFAIRFNRMHNYKGHVWYDRFKSKIISTYIQFLNTITYIANNPVRTRIVNDPLEYEYSSVKYYRNQDFSILEVPDNELASMYNHFFINYEHQHALRTDKLLGFYPEKPGRKEIIT